MSSVQPLIKKMTDTARYVITVRFVRCCEAGTWTWEEMRTTAPMARRNHWSLMNHFRTSRAFARLGNCFLTDDLFPSLVSDVSASRGSLAFGKSRSGGPVLIESIFVASVMRSSAIVPLLPSMDDRLDGVAAVRISISSCLSIEAAV